MRLPRPVTTVQEQGQHVLPICLAWHPDIKQPTSLFRQSLTVGWGITNELNPSGDLHNSGAVSPELHKVDVPIVGFAVCKHKYLNRFNIRRDRHVCAGDEGVYYPFFKISGIN